MNATFWRDKRVFITGHTGFKGSWLAFMLQHLGASVSGFALPPATSPSLFELLHIEQLVRSRFGDIRNRDDIRAALRDARPEIIMHLAAQPLVRASLRDPAGTFETNVIGLVNVIDAAREYAPGAVFLNVTTDKVYQDEGDGRAHRETDRLGGDDPYSASKACAEIVTACYRKTIVTRDRLAIATARAGNVIGGGDWSEDRIVPDIVRAVVRGETVVLRYPEATRPWQHVLEPLSGYLTVVEAMVARGEAFDGAWNFGPPDSSESMTVGQLTEQLIVAFKSGARWTQASDVQPAERKFLQLDSSRAARELGWRPRLTMDETVRWTAQWYTAWRDGEDVRAFTTRQIDDYLHREVTQ